jgi:hypothetical protein
MIFLSIQYLLSALACDLQCTIYRDSISDDGFTLIVVTMDT